MSPFSGKPSPIADDYTVFVQVVNSGGVVNKWIAGRCRARTYQPMAHRRVIRDPYVLCCPSELPEDNYQLLIGLYRLFSLRQVPVLAGKLPRG
ncbi:MAG: hypothetical protein IPL28_22790 [Chloroflexi bacterium]|nr:hypothetical protein [Chloroflexota bacterium]